MPSQDHNTAQDVIKPVSHYQAPDTLMSQVLDRVAWLPIAEKHTIQSKPEILLQASAWEERAMVLNFLDMTIATPPLDSVLLALEDEHEMVRAAAISALGRMGEQAPLEHIIVALKDPCWEVREMAVLTLGSLHNPVIRSLLQAAQQDSHIMVQEAATEMLALIAEEPVSPYGQKAIALSQKAGWHIIPKRQMVMEAIRSARIDSQRWLDHSWQILVWQYRLFRFKWLGGIALLLLCSLFLGTVIPFHGRIQDTATTLAFLTTLSTAIGIAFSINVHHENSAELVLATPTPRRLLVLCRFILVVGLHMILSACVSVVIALAYGQGIWGMIEVWLGPLCLISSLTIVLVPLLGSWISLLLTGALELLQLLQLNADGHIQMQTHAWLWHTNPLLLCLAICCLVLATVIQPRQAIATPDDFNE